VSTDTNNAYQAFTDALIADFRAHDGQVTSGFFVGRPLLLLHTRGAKSGEQRIAPVAYTRDGDQYVIVASKSGAPTHPAWYLSLLANPRATVEVGGETFDVRATPVDDPDERRRLYDAHAEVHDSFKDYESKTERVIPVVLLDRID